MLNIVVSHLFSYGQIMTSQHIHIPIIDKNRHYIIQLGQLFYYKNCEVPGITKNRYYIIQL